MKYKKSYTLIALALILTTASILTSCKNGFRKVLECIIEDLHLNISDESNERKRYLLRPSSPVIKPKPPTTSAEKPKRFKLYEQAFTNEELKFWMHYAVDRKSVV